MKTQFLFALLFAGSSFAADLTSSGSWFKLLSASDLTAGAGSGLPTNLESVSGVTVLNLSAVGPWEVKARKGNGLPNGVTLWVRRTSAGTGSGTVEGGEAFVELGSSDSSIFSGSGDRSNISIQYKVTGLSVAVAPGSYTSPIIFTAY